MKKIIIILSTLILASCGGDDGGSSSGSSARNPYPQATLIAIGDSICNGQTASLGWADILRNRGYNVIYKDCKNGRQVHDMGSILPDLIATYNPTHVLIMLGTNDAINGHPSEAVSALQRMANQAADRGVIPVISTIPPSTRSSQISGFTSRVNGGIRGLSASRIPQPAISTDMLNDGTHPNDTGQAIIVDAFIGKLR